MKAWFRGPSDLPNWDILFRLTLIEILLRPAGPWTIRPFILLLAAAALIFGVLLRSSLYWFTLFGFITARIIADWPLPDNHIYLLAYWCVLLVLVLRSPMPELTLKTGSRFLIGFAFLMAFVWKAFLSPDFVDGRFFRVTLQTDERFASTAMLIGRLTKQQLRENRDYLIPLPEGAELMDPPRLTEPRQLRIFSAAATWLALILEGSVAILFLVPLKKAWQSARHYVLLLFCLLTYPFAPVAGFGWLLLVMGLAQCDQDQRAIRTLYIISYFLVLLFAEIPWAGAILEAMGS